MDAGLTLTSLVGFLHDSPQDVIGALINLGKSTLGIEAVLILFCFAWAAGKGHVWELVSELALEESIGFFWAEAWYGSGRIMAGIKNSRIHSRERGWGRAWVGPAVPGFIEYGENR